MAKAKEQTPSRKTTISKKPTGEFFIKGYVQAINILVGAGIPVNEKEKTMVWFYDKPQSRKVVKAGGFLDSYQVEQKNNFKTIWTTVAGYAENKKTKGN
jgi:hypothetical protein